MLAFATRTVRADDGVVQQQPPRQPRLVPDVLQLELVLRLQLRPRDGACELQERHRRPGPQRVAVIDVDVREDLGGVREGLCQRFDCCGGVRQDRPGGAMGHASAVRRWRRTRACDQTLQNAPVPRSTRSCCVSPGRHQTALTARRRPRAYARAADMRRRGFAASSPTSLAGYGR